MSYGRVPGDGKSNPKGNGQGSGEEGGSVSSNDFVTNPHGSAKGTRPRDFITQRREQSKVKPDVAGDGASGGLIPNAAPPATRPGGVGTPGNASKPFRLGG